MSCLREISPKVKVTLLERFGGAMELYFTTREDLSELKILSPRQTEELMRKDLGKTDGVMEYCEGEGVRILTIQDAEYPLRLKNIPDPPCALYIKGRLPAIDEEALVSVVGTRGATPYGIKMARRIGYEATKCGGLICSGLAAGIDSAAVEGALRAGGGAVGVLGTGIDEIYPKFNKPLFDDVAAVGAYLTEYPPGTPMFTGAFPMRNRIIAGLAVGVTIIEAPHKSGALITADYALEYGRDVFAVPGNADSPKSQGSNALIRDGAKAVTCGWDICGEYAALFPKRLRMITGDKAKIPQEQEALAEPESVSVPRKKTAKAPETGEGFLRLRTPPAKKEIDKENGVAYIGLEEQLSNLSEKQLKIISFITKPCVHVDDIIDVSGLPAREVLSELTMLQIQGVVTQEAGKRFSLNIKH
jgi:DNA processing protein